MSDYKFAGKETDSKSKKGEKEADESSWMDWLFGRGALKKAAGTGDKKKDKSKKMGSTSYMKERIAATKKNVGEGVKNLKSVGGRRKKKSKDSYER